MSISLEKCFIPKLANVDFSSCPGNGFANRLTA